MIDVKSCGAVGDGVTDDTAAVQAALSLPGATVFPAGSYLVSGLVVPPGASLVGEGVESSRLLRSGDAPVLVFAGYPAGVDDTPAHYGASVSDLTVGEGGVVSGEPVVRLSGVSAARFDRVRVESYSGGAPLMELLQVWDTRFVDCMFHGGGSNTTGIGAVRVLADIEGYRQTKETFFRGCWWESYRGPAVEFARGGSGQKPQVIHFTDCKMESRYTDREHIRLHANMVRFSGVYVTHELTAGPVVDMIGARGVYGDLRFYQIQSPQSVTPSALVGIDAGCRYVDLDVVVSEPQPPGLNVVSLANPSDPTIQVRINADAPTINGTQTKVHRVPFSTVQQAVNAGTGACQYVWSKEGRAEWSLGNPNTPNGKAERMHLRANNTDFLTFQSDGPDPAASPRRVNVNAMLTLGSAWDATNLLRLGEYALWVDRAGVLRMKRGAPVSDTDGSAVGF